MSGHGNAMNRLGSDTEQGDQIRKEWNFTVRSGSTRGGLWDNNNEEVFESELYAG